jgi:hypothetical protein
MADDVRFGRHVADLPVELEFGEWGTLETVQALDLFEDAHTYFDQEAVQKAEKARKLYIQAAWQYYDGWHKKPLVVRPGERDDNILLNFCRVLVNDAVAWLFGHPETGVLQFEVDEPGVPEDVEDAEVIEDATLSGLEQAIVLLEGVYTSSGGFVFFQRWGMQGTVAGHFFIKLVPRKNPGSADPTQGELMTLDVAHPARLVVLDPEQVSVMTDPVDITRPVAFKIEWERTIKEDGRKNTYLYRQLVVRQDKSEGDPEAWVVADFRAKKQFRKRAWELVNGPFAWPWNWCPIVDGPNLVHGKRYWGLTDLEDVTGVNDAINFSASNTGRILNIHGHPKTVGTGFTADEVQDTSIDSMWTIPSAEAKVQNLEMESDLTAAQNFIELLKMAFWTIGRGLDLSVFKDRIGQVTNFGLRILAHRALTKNGDKRILYGAALTKINAHLLEMGGLKGFTTSVKWPDPLPDDPQMTVNVQKSEKEMGLVSRQTLAEERGRSWVVEKKRMEEEGKERMNLGKFLTDQFDRGVGDGEEAEEDGQDS